MCCKALTVQPQTAVSKGTQRCNGTIDILHRPSTLGRADSQPPTDDLFQCGSMPGCSAIAACSGSSGRQLGFLVGSEIKLPKSFPCCLLNCKVPSVNPVSQGMPTLAHIIPFPANRTVHHFWVSLGL